MSTPAAPGSVVGKPPPGRLARLGRGSGWQGFFFISPALVLLGALLVYPVVWTVRLSVDKGRRQLEPHEFVGLDNFKRLLTDDRRFLDLSEFPPSGALINNLRWIVLYTALCVILGLAIAVLASRVRYESLIKAVIFVPMAISATAVAMIWLFVYSPDPDQGVLNAALQGINSGFDPISWVGREGTVNYAIIFAYVWASTGFAMVVLSAALKGISTEVIEAARTDGATDWAIFRRIQLPLLSLPIAVVTVWLIINVIKVFDIVYVMSGGGPSGASEVIANRYFIETFDGGKGGYGAAMAVIMLLMIIPIMAFNIRRFRSEAVTR
ncbi:MAG: sugar ABC transporter permease [Actinobacteria bacterium]|nr:sugar ABC transporter permease [Actinomycetota bacterium]